MFYISILSTTPREKYNKNDQKKGSIKEPKRNTGNIRYIESKGKMIAISIINNFI